MCSSIYVQLVSSAFSALIPHSLYQESAILVENMPAEKLKVQLHSKLNRNMAISLSIFFH